MKIDWSGVIKDLRNLSPALYGRLIRHVLTMLAGAGLLKGLSADQTNALQGLIEIAASGVLFGITILMSHNSDEAVKKDAAMAPLSEDDIEMIIREINEDKANNRAGLPSPSTDANDTYRPGTPPSVPPTGGER